MRKNEDREKEFFSLWIEYLKRSSDYKDFCDWIAQKRKNPELPWPTKFRENARQSGSTPKEILNYHVFGPIHEPRWTFNEWWKNHQKKLSYRKSHSSPRPIEDYIEIMPLHMKSCAESFERHEGREPTLKEFIDTFPSYLKKDPFIWLMINVSIIETKELKNQFGKLISQKIKEPRFRIEGQFDRRWYEPSTNYIRFDELKRHLRIYDFLEAGMKWKNIAEGDEAYKNHSADPETTKRLIYMDREKARIIIKNTEYGIFPGKYEGVKAKK